VLGRDNEEASNCETACEVMISCQVDDVFDDVMSDVDGDRRRTVSQGSASEERDGGPKRSDVRTSDWESEP
jgi:hypothetical protein